MSVWYLVAGLSLLLLYGVWAHKRLPHWQAADARARREPLTAEQFGERFFPPDQAKIATRLREIAAKELNRDLTRLHPDDPLAQVFFAGSDSLDSVELLMAIEDEFGIELDEATAVKIATSRDLVNAVAAVLGNQVRAQESCQSQRGFHLLRGAMMRVLRVPRSLITPTTPLDKLINWRTASSVWSQLRDAVGARQWPPLVRPRWMSWLVFLCPLLGGAALAVGLPPLADWASSRESTLGFVVIHASELRGFIVVPLVIFLWMLLVRLSKRFSRALPRNIRTVGDLVPFLATSAEMTWTREQIEQRVREIVVKRLWLPTEGYQAGARFVEEFGFEVGMQNP